jgi:molybdopterin molybdotransferase
MSQPLISIRAARELVLSEAKPLGIEEVGIDRALDRVLARDLDALGDVPPFPSSAMDGYAVQPGPAGRELAIVDESRAGFPSGRSLGHGEAIRISTGAAVPVQATAVIPQERVSRRGSRIETLAAVAEGDNVRGAGEDMQAGARVLRAGSRLGPPELGAAVAAGARALTVATRPRVAVLCTGDELRAPGEHLGPGEIHNSNGPMLVALAGRCGSSAAPERRVRDDREDTEAELRGALQRSDVVVISGGVSVGPHDHVKPALEALGVREVFWGVALQPGKPTWFGVKDRTLVFGLPGNPVSAAVTFSLFAVPALAAMQGLNGRAGRRATAVLGVPVRRNSQREQALRVRIEQRSGGEHVAVPNGPQGSHIVTSLIGADGLALIPPGDGELAAGTPVEIEPLLH